MVAEVPNFIVQEQSHHVLCHLHLAPLVPSGAISHTSLIDTHLNWSKNDYIDHAHVSFHCLSENTLFAKRYVDMYDQEYI